MEIADCSATPVSIEMNLVVASTKANIRSKKRPINEVDKSPQFNDVSDKSLRTKVFNLVLENKTQKTIIIDLTNKV